MPQNDARTKQEGDVIDVDFRYLPGTRPDEPRPPVRTLGRLAREFRTEGVPPVPRPTVGTMPGVELPLLYPGVLNGLAGPAGTAKTALSKYVLRQVIWGGGEVLAMDCETFEREYTATLMGDFGMGAAELDRLSYMTDKQGRTPNMDRWSGMDEGLASLLSMMTCSPSLVIIDSQSKSMALQGLDENRPIDCARWFEGIAEPIADRWPDAAIVTIQGRQKGWHVGQDVRQGRGSSSLLHEVTAQYMLWTKVQGSRVTDGLVELVCTKDRYGHRTEGTKAALWKYGPSGFELAAPDAETPPLDPSVIRQAWLDYLDDDVRDEHDLPPKRMHAVEAVTTTLGESATTAAVEKALDALIKGGQVSCERLHQSIGGVRPERVWTGEPKGWAW